jgi:hypothetical protein
VARSPRWLAGKKTMHSKSKETLNQSLRGGGETPRETREAPTHCGDTGEMQKRSGCIRSTMDRGAGRRDTATARSTTAAEAVATSSLAALGLAT